MEKLSNEHACEYASEMASDNVRGHTRLRDIRSFVKLWWRLIR